MEDIIQSYKDAHKKEEILKAESWMIPDPYYISRDTSIREAAKEMANRNIEFIPVVGEDQQPIGIVTSNDLLERVLNNEEEDSVGNGRDRGSNAVIRRNESIFDVISHAASYFSVVDNQGKLVGLLSKNEILKGFSSYINEIEHSADILNVILESAYEGVAVVDEHGILQEFNDAYSRFTGISPEAAIGRHVEEVIDNTKLPETLKTGMPERGVIQYIQGQAMIVHRIPIWKNDQVVGAIGILIFEGVSEVYRIYESLQENTRQKQVIPPTQNSYSPKKQETSIMTLEQIIGDSESISNQKRVARKVAKTDATVLITGESGTGKEMYARGIHHLSPFSTGHFVSVNCGAIPEHLFESELFGYEEGAFTGARKGGKPGKFELAQNGTLFLDEIGEMPLLMQAKLLRVLQEKQVGRVGGTHEYQINTRIIAATNRNLKEMVETGDFREDLYYRLNIIEIPIPPLRERTEDIPQLVSYYINNLCEKYDTPKKVLTSEAMALLLKYDWPGNIRELINTLEKLVVLVDDTFIDVSHLPAFLKQKEAVKVQNNESISPILQAKNIGNAKEKELIRTVLRKTGGNKTKAAEKLGIHRTTLYQKLKKYALHEL
ncbi:PAS domain S-box-containing protein [Thalassobacillus cyri]|uniref:PAS domain S-box-containing protein n=1 Tax=Thalassobacillus cyri TaxID=571932 RepID=A0A1H4AFL4_9BACI|nr:sigma-54-dependent Fis family transcriptional regulator [Thalassobacillus cyri]SEA34292.1 PAS domain S-box-containing protein [Thalassobacillus cyri]